MKYVTFLEAMEALSQGESVVIHIDNLAFDITPCDELIEYFGLTFRDLTLSKWSIVEGCGC